MKTKHGRTHARLSPMTGFGIILEHNLIIPGRSSDTRM
jgi:hypothetical protein